MHKGFVLLNVHMYVSCSSFQKLRALSTYQPYKCRLLKKGFGCKSSKQTEDEVRINQAIVDMFVFLLSLIKDMESENVKTIQYFVGPTDFLSVPHKITVQYSAIFRRSAGPTCSKICRSGRIFVGPGPTDQRYSYSLWSYTVLWNCEF